MSIKKSRNYTQDDGSKVSFDFDGGKLVGIKKDGTSLNPESVEFVNLANTDDALAAYNVSKYTSAKKSYEDSISIASKEERDDYYTNQSKKETNEDKDIKSDTRESESSKNIAFPPRNLSAGREKLTGVSVFAYPIDIDPQQDHLKIKKFKYSRPASNVQAGRPFNVKTETKPIYKKNKRQRRVKKIGEKITTTNVAGDSVKGMEQLGSVILPMPKVVDTNGCEWGESKVNIFGLAAMSMGQNLGKLGMSEEQQENIKKIQKNLKKKGGMGTSSLRDIAGATGASVFSQAAITALGQQISNNEFLARTGGRILNPNAELLFQGPVLRDFNFDFLMVARSREEGEEIRRIIRWFKTGMAPKFTNSTFLANPDIFTLEYKRGRNDLDILDTVNRFSPGGLALRTIQVDYAPNGSWSAYQDSQPVALRMSLNFAELRPIFESDQEMTPETSVGY
tara:strand:- start:681 stop:2033 length:1353 start_codon:yes stop_codon:yes gene_type:complete